MPNYQTMRKFSYNCIIPKQSEIQGRNLEPSTLRFDADTWVLDYQSGDIVREWSLTRESLNEYLLEHSSGSNNLGVFGDEVEYSVYDYADIMHKRGCDKEKSISLILEDLSKRLSIVTDSNREEVCAWIVQLSYDTGQESNRTLYGLRGLEDELKRVLREMKT